MNKQRLDVLLVELQLCQSRQQAQLFIRAGSVKVNREIIDKPGTEVDIKAQIELQKKPDFVSRGGEKLKKAINVFNIAVNNRICLDGGISTGGFTDCLLQAGAKQVYGVDVGYGQVAWTIRQDRRVVLKERTNLRYLTYFDLYGESTPANLGVVDVSFISLSKILPALWNLLVAPKEVILLIKPQFEVGKERVGKKGVVRDEKARAEAIVRVLETAEAMGWQYGGLTPSPLKGPAGNIEYLVWLQESSTNKFPTIEEILSIAAKIID